MWNLDVLEKVYDLYIDQHWRLYLDYLNSSECSSFLNSCKKNFLKSFLNKPPDRVSGIIISAFYININELSVCDLDNFSTGFCVHNFNSANQGLGMLESLVELHKESNILWLRIPFVEQQQQHYTKTTSQNVSDKNVSAFMKVVNVVLNTIIYVNNKHFISPVPVLNLATEKQNEMIEKLSLDWGKRPNFIFLKSVHPKIVAECDFRISNCERRSDIFEALQEKYQTLDYFDQMLNIFKHIVKSFEFEAEFKSSEVEKKNTEFEAAEFNSSDVEKKNKEAIDQEQSNGLSQVVQDQQRGEQPNGTRSTSRNEVITQRPNIGGQAGTLRDQVITH